MKFRRLYLYALIFLLLAVMSTETSVVHAQEELPEQPRDISSFIPPAITIGASIIAAAWCITQGSTIGASSSIERGEPSSWGMLLNLTGAVMLVYGFVSAQMLMIKQTISPGTLISGVMLLGSFVMIVFLGKDREGVSLGGVVAAIISALSIVFVMISGGEGSVIPEAAWPLLMGALTMIGAGFAAAVCIVAAVRSGSEMITQRPELSIWSLLYVALGEGLAIYGLIVAILLITG
ncbi:hypothetical protein AC482_00390 [miscellaneous Crenarchaeota group-15 archaeon DG-45]|uniref:V-ATPase proteolipid subunit C-like domain-containing protein n=1 Tax=miscellaneous Crenarchaeota group-15 archaeon DG-45 TaxID=1685127 RepID=A0A0M0BT77_9ARCH|nr:MAG: hypothetical protein AC482_00390 [miscellaneous Crenarchaeota group-15 archaeon DG-45]